jgi:hypothetical protein
MGDRCGLIMIGGQGSAMMVVHLGTKGVISYTAKGYVDKGVLLILGW